MRLGQLRKPAIAIAIIAAAAGGYVSRGVTVGPSRAAANDNTPAAPPRLAPPDFSAIVREYGPAVVNISVTGTVKTATDATPFGQLDPEDPFFQFFKRFHAPQGEQMMRGLGSGFIVKADGVVLTNAPVVANASEGRIKITDGREYTAH